VPDALGDRQLNTDRYLHIFGGKSEYTTMQTTPTTTTKIASLNEAWGFFDTLRSNLKLSETEIENAFDRAARFTATRLEMTTEAARRFLDSKLGRHLADAFSAGDKIEEKLDSLYGSWKRDVREFRNMAINSTDEDFYS